MNELTGQQEQLKVQSAHTKAFTMLDDDEKQMVEAAMQEQQAAAAEAPAEEKKPEPKPAEGEWTCPNCGVPMKESKYDPSWVDEIALMDAIIGDD